MVVAQLVERLLPTPEVHGLNPVIRQTFILDIYRQLCIEKTKIKKKRPGKAHFKKQHTKPTTAAIYVLWFKDKMCNVDYKNFAFKSTTNTQKKIEK